MIDNCPLAGFIIRPYARGKQTNGERVDVSIPFGNENIKVRVCLFVWIISDLRTPGGLLLRFHNGL